MNRLFCIGLFIFLSSSCGHQSALKYKEKNLNNFDLNFSLVSEALQIYPEKGRTYFLLKKQQSEFSNDYFIVSFDDNFNNDSFFYLSPYGINEIEDFTIRTYRYKCYNLDYRQEYNTLPKDHSLKFEPELKGFLSKRNKIIEEIIWQDSKIRLKYMEGPKDYYKNPLDILIDNPRQDSIVVSLKDISKTARFISLNELTDSNILLSDYYYFKNAEQSMGFVEEVCNELGIECSIE